jgi:formiminotetrahydrofolate cyclodeaminase
MSERSSIGEKRLEYLDFANKALTSGDFGTAERSMGNFLMTIRENTPESKKIQEKFDSLHDELNAAFMKVMQDTEKVEAFTQTEQRAKARDYFLAKNIQDRINICWTIAMENGLFND